MANIINYVSNQNLAYYDEKLKAWVVAQDAQVLADAKAHAIEYADSLATNYDPAGTAQTKVNELANGAVADNTSAIDAINNEETGILKQAKDYADSKDAAIQNAQDAADAAQEGVNGLTPRVKANEDAIAAIETDMGDVDSLSTTNKNVVGAIEELKVAIGAGGTASAITVSTEATTDGALKSYTIKQGENTVGVIDIPKDMVVESGEVVTNPEGMAEGTYIKLVLANVTDPLYINVGTLVDIYKAKADATQIQIAIDSASREISASVVAGSIGTTELADNAVTTAKIADNNVTKAKLSATLQASIDKADAAAPQTSLDTEVQRAKDAEAKALSDAQAYADQAEADAVSTAAADAKAKADQALADAKAYADSKVEGVDLSGIATNAADIDKLEASLAEGGATANAIADAKKAGTDAQGEVDALETVVSGVSDKANANETAITGLDERIDALEAVEHQEMSTAEIDAMFAE